MFWHFFRLLFLTLWMKSSPVKGQAPSLGNVAITGRPDPGGQACTNLDFLYQACASLTPGFTDLVFTRQASCLCYGWISSHAFEPSIHDSFFTSCNAYLSASLPSAYSTLSAFYSGNVPTAPCQTVGDIASATASDTYGASDLLAAASLAQATLMTATPAGALTNTQLFATPTFFSTPTVGGSRPFLPTPGTATTTPGQLTGVEASAGSGPTTTTTGSAAASSQGAGAPFSFLEAPYGLIAGLFGFLAML